VSDLADWPDDPAERARELVEGVLDELDLDGDVEIEEDDDRILINVVGGEDYGLLIGKRGQTIDALQLLCYQAAFRGLRERKRVVVDAVVALAHLNLTFKVKLVENAFDQLSDPLGRLRRPIPISIAHRAGSYTAQTAISSASLPGWRLGAKSAPLAENQIVMLANRCFGGK
jgi:predicted RNA-binding protein YlqC (UPF0109 family)